MTIGASIKDVLTLGEGGREGGREVGRGFSCKWACVVSVREKSVFKGHFIIIFLYKRLKIKEVNKK